MMQDAKVSEADVKRLRAAFDEALDDREDMRDARDEALAERDRYRKALERIGRVHGEWRPVVADALGCSVESLDAKRKLKGA